MSKIAIILPLLDRHEFTERILGYYNLNKVEYTFYLADGSKVKKFNEKYLKKKFPFVKIVYKAFPFDSNFRFFTSKMTKIIQLIKSSYIYQIANDDFFNPNFLVKAESFLNKNKSYSLVGGQVKNIKVLQLFKLINDHGIIKIQKELQYFNYGNVYKDISFDSKEKRIAQFTNSLTYECLIRRSVYSKILKLAHKFKINNSFEMNWFYNIIPLLEGKKKFIKMISTVRQSNTHDGLGVREMLKDGAKRERYIEFLKFLKNKNIITSKSIIKKLRSANDFDLDIIDPKSSDGKKHKLKKKWFPAYSFIKRMILNFNFIFSYIFFLFYTNKYKSLFLKIKMIFNNKNHNHI